MARAPDPERSVFAHLDIHQPTFCPQCMLTPSKPHLFVPKKASLPAGRHINPFSSLQYPAASSCESAPSCTNLGSPAGEKAKRAWVGWHTPLVVFGTLPGCAYGIILPSISWFTKLLHNRRQHSQEGGFLSIEGILKMPYSKCVTLLFCQEKAAATITLSDGQPQRTYLLF